MRCNLLTCRHIARFVLTAALLTGWATLAVAQFGAPYIDPDVADKGPDPREELHAEAALPGVEPEEALRAVIRNRNDKTLLNGEMRATDRPVEPFIDASTGQLQAELAEAKVELAKTKKLVGEIIKENRAIAEARELPPLKDAQVRVFQLKNSKASVAAEKVELLFGTQPIRIAVDDASNGLIVFGKAEAIPQVEQLILKLDELAVAGRDGELGFAFDRGSLPATAARRTLMLRVFWLADGVQDGIAADDYLPKAVINSLAKLGLNNPQLVTQTVNSISVQEGAQPVQFSTNIPAMLFERQVSLSCEGTMAATTDNRADVEVHLTVGGIGLNCDLKGSLATPLGHFMVLGTANSVIPDNGAGGFGMAPMEHSEGMPMGRGMEGGRGMGGFGGEGAIMGAQAPAKFNTSRFAFVVQVIEGESFAPEK